MKIYVVTAHIDKCGSAYAENWGLYSTIDNVLNAWFIDRLDDKEKQRLRDTLAKEDFVSFDFAWKDKNTKYDLTIEHEKVDADVKAVYIGSE